MTRDDVAPRNFTPTICQRSQLERGFVWGLSFIHVHATDPPTVPSSIQRSLMQCAPHYLARLLSFQLFPRFLCALSFGWLVGWKLDQVQVQGWFSVFIFQFRRVGWFAAGARLWLQFLAYSLLFRKGVRHDFTPSRMLSGFPHYADWMIDCPSISL